MSKKLDVIESFRNNYISEFSISEDGENQSISFTNYKQTGKIIPHYRANINNTSLEIGINDPDLIILLNEYYLKQDEIANRIQSYFSRGAQGNLNFLENKNKIHYQKSLFKLIAINFLHVFFFLFAATLIFTSLAYYTEIMRLFHLESGIWFLFFYLIIVMMGQVVYRASMSKLVNKRVHKNAIQSYRKYNEDYKMKISKVKS
jgi:hypothetical protein